MKYLHKRITSILLVFILPMTMLPVTVMATETEAQLADPISEHEIANFGEMKEALAIEVPAENSAEDPELLQRSAPEEGSASPIEEELSFEMPTLLAGEGTAFGECGAQGNNLTWVLDDEGTLTVSGAGEMEDWPTWNGLGSEIRTVVLSNGVTSIGEGAFWNCDSLTSVTIPDSVTYIGTQAFRYCRSLTNITIPDSVAYIGDWTFGGCFSLRTVTFEGDAPAFGSNVFSNVRAKVYYPADNTSWTYEIMQDYGGDIRWTVQSNLTWNLGDEGTLTISGSGPMEDYLSFLDSAPWYSQRGDITAVVIENGVTRIGTQAFYDCYNLTNVVIPNSVTSIGGSGFACCASLTNITIPESVTSIGISAFERCENLAAIRIPNGVTYIDDWTFASCTSLTDIAIPNSVTGIGNFAFDCCFSLDNITIPDSVTNIGECAFRYCNSLTSITIPDHVTTVGIEAFYGCRNLVGITVAGGNTAYASQNGLLYNRDKTELICCTAGKTGTIEIPGSVNAIWENAFSECYGVTAITVAGGNTAYVSQNGILYNRDKTELVCCPAGKTGVVEIPGSVSVIGHNAFADCGSLTDIMIPNSVTEIAYGSFAKCSGLSSVTIPNSVVSIDTWAFGNCGGLNAVAFEGNAPSFGWGTFYGITTTAYYPVNNATWTDDVKQNYGGNIRWAMGIPVSTEAEVRAAIIAAAEDPNTCHEITIDFPLTLTEDLEIPVNVDFYIWGRGSLTIPEGVTLTTVSRVYCTTDLTVAGTWRNDPCKREEGTWWDYVRNLTVSGRLENNSYIECDSLTLERTGEIATGRSITVYNDYTDNDGTIIGNPIVVRHEIYAATEAKVRAAIIAAAEDPNTRHEIIIDLPLTLTEDLEIPENAELHIWEPGSLTISEGVTLTVFGQISCNTTLTIAGTLRLEDSSWGNQIDTLVLEHAGIIRNQGDLHVRESFANNGGTVIGNPIAVRHEIYDATEAKVRAAIIAAAEDPNTRHEIIIDLLLTLTEDLEIPENANLHVLEPGSLMIPEGVTLTVFGGMFCDTILMVAGTLHLEDGGYRSTNNLALEHTGIIRNRGYLQVSDSFTNNGGTVIGDPIVICHEIYAATEADVRAAVSAAVEAPEESYNITIDFPLTLTEDLEIPENAELNIWEPGSLTIPEGVTLITAGGVYCATLTVAGTLDLKNNEMWRNVNDLVLESTGTICNAGHFDVEGTFTDNGGTVTGNPIVTYLMVASEQELREAISEMEETSKAVSEIYVSGSITLSEDLIVPENIELRMYDEADRLVIPTGVTLTTAGKLYASNMTVAGAWNANHELNCVENLTIEAGGVIRNKGLVEVPGTYINHGDAIPGVVGCGDVNGDGEVNALDLLRVKKALAVGMFDSAQMDVTGDGTINALDLLRLKRYLAGEDVELSYGSVEIEMVSSSPVTG